VPEEYNGTSYRDICLYLWNAPSASPTGDAFLDEFRDVDPWGEFSDPQPAPDSDCERLYSLLPPTYSIYLLSYVLFYAEGGRGYNRSMQLNGPAANGKSFLSFSLIVDADPFCVTGKPRIHELLTIWAFYRYHAYIRRRSFNVLHRGAALFQQYLVDIWLSIELIWLPGFLSLGSRMCQ
jgi:hypothetical protein